MIGVNNQKTIIEKPKNLLLIEKDKTLILELKKKIFNKGETGLFIDMKFSLNFMKLYEKKVVKKTNAISCQFTWI